MSPLTRICLRKLRQTWTNPFRRVQLSFSLFLEELCKETLITYLVAGSGHLLNISLYMFLLI
jgi:hypothetical protein